MAVGRQGGRELLTVGQSFGIYRVVCRLGRGGMGMVYLLENPADGSRVATASGVNASCSSSGIGGVNPHFSAITFASPTCFTPVMTRRANHARIGDTA